MASCRVVFRGLHLRNYYLRRFTSEGGNALFEAVPDWHEASTFPREEADQLAAAWGAAVEDMEKQQQRAKANGKNGTSSVCDLAVVLNMHMKGRGGQT